MSDERQSAEDQQENKTPKAKKKKGKGKKLKKIIEHMCCAIERSSMTDSTRKHHLHVIRELNS